MLEAGRALWEIGCLCALRGVGAPPGGRAPAPQLRLLPREAHPCVGWAVCGLPEAPLPCASGTGEQYTELTLCDPERAVAEVRGEQPGRTGAGAAAGGARSLMPPAQPVVGRGPPAQTLPSREAFPA